MIDAFFAGLLAAGIAGSIYYVADAHLWRVSSWIEDRCINRLIRRRR